MQYLPLLNNTALTPAPKGNYGTVILSHVAPLLDQNIRQKLCKEPLRSQFPLTFEEIGQRYGFVLYETILAWPVSDPALFSIPGISDRAIVLLDDVSFKSCIHYLSYCTSCYKYYNFYKIHTPLDILYILVYCPVYFTCGKVSCFILHLLCIVQEVYMANSIEHRL